MLCCVAQNMLKIFREYLQNVLVGGTRAVGGTDPPLFFLP